MSGWIDGYKTVEAAVATPGLLVVLWGKVKSVFRRGEEEEWVEGYQLLDMGKEN